MTRDEIITRMVGNPACCYAVFTHRQGFRWSVGKLVRQELAELYRTGVKEQHDLCGLAWYEGSRIWFTYRDGLRMNKGPFTWLGPAKIFEVSPVAAKYARGVMEWSLEDGFLTCPGWGCNQAWKAWQVLNGKTLRIAARSAEPLAEALSMYTVPTDRVYLGEYKDFDPYLVSVRLEIAGLPCFLV